MFLFTYVLSVMMTILILHHIIYGYTMTATVDIGLDRNSDPVDIKNQILNSYRETRVISLKNVKFSPRFEKVEILSKEKNPSIRRTFHGNQTNTNVHIFNVSSIGRISIYIERTYHFKIYDVVFSKRPDVKFE